MRQFRGIRIDNDEWVDGFYFEAYNDIMRDEPQLQGFIIESHIFVLQTKSVIKDRLVIADFVEVRPETVGQYTGLRDCKRTEEYPEGQKIWESDIAKDIDSGVIGVVEYSISRLRWGLRREAGWVYSFLPENLEILGNIHQQPELLEVKE